MTEDDATAQGADASASDAGADDATVIGTDAGAADGDGGGASVTDGGNGAADDWRTQFATGESGEPDAELLKFLGRYHSPGAAIGAWKKQNDSIAKGEYVKPLPGEPSEDEIKSYRKDFGIPETAEGYAEKFPDGLVVGDDDKPFVDKFLANMHAQHAPPAAVNAALDTYYQLVQEQESKAADDYLAAKEASEEELRNEWGPEYKRNVNAAKAYVGALPENVQRIFSEGMFGDGTGIGNNPEVAKWITSLALAENPAATLIPGAGSNQANAIADEIKELEKQMGNPQSDYWKDPQKQERYRQLVDAKEQLDKAA